MAEYVIKDALSGNRLLAPDIKDMPGDRKIGEPVMTSNKGKDKGRANNSEVEKKRKSKKSQYEEEYDSDKAEFDQSRSELKELKELQDKHAIGTLGRLENKLKNRKF